MIFKPKPMQNNSFKIVGMIMLCIILNSCGQQTEPTANQELIASTQGYDLTEAHFNSYLKFIETQAGETSNIQTQIALKSQMKQAFLNDPEGLLNELQQLALASNNKETAFVNTETKPSQPINNNTPSTMAEGHKIVREILGSDIGEMQFDTQAANTFRAFMTSTLLTARTNSSNNGYGSSDYSNSKGQIRFCANGTFVEVLSGHLSIGTEGMDATSSGSSAMPGYWAAAALPNGMNVIIMYSTHPRMLEDSANGILPFVVAKHGPDFVQLPSGDLYARTANHYCN